LPGAFGVGVQASRPYLPFPKLYDGTAKGILYGLGTGKPSCQTSFGTSCKAGFAQTRGGIPRNRVLMLGPAAGGGGGGGGGSGQYT
jgi:hypothetical protein